MAKINILRSICIILIFCCTTTFAQKGQTRQASNKERIIKGVVVSKDGEPLTGSGVILKGTGIGTVTDIEGKFELKIPEDKVNGVLVFSSIGFEEQEQSIGSRSFLEIVLRNNLQLEEVIVLGYGTQKKEFVLGAVSQIDTKELMKAPNTDATNMLAGRLSGLTAIQHSGEPGKDNSTMFVRGISTYNQNKGPLYIIDGMESPSIAHLNPSDIASVSILKDAATASIYGVKGGNGVILITTRSGGKSGKSIVSYDGSMTLTTHTSMPEMLNAEEYIYWHNLARTLDGAEPIWNKENLAKLESLGILGDTDWRGLLFHKFGKMQQHNISAHGGNDKFTYFSSVGYMNQDGIMKNTGFKRYNVRANINASPLSGMRYNINISGRHSRTHSPGYNINAQDYFSPIQRAHYSIPLIKNTYNNLPLGVLNGASVLSPDSALNNSGYRDTQAYACSITSSLEYSFDNIEALKGLKLTIFGGFDFLLESSDNYLNSYKLYYLDRSKMEVFPTVAEGIGESFYSKADTFRWNYNLRPQISYERTFGKHSVSATGLFEKTKLYYDTMSAYKRGYVSDKPMNLNAGAFDNRPAEGKAYYTGDVGFAGRINYAFAQKYIAEFSFREAASYVFSPKNRWGFFPAVSLGWTMSKEKFIKDNVSWVNHLKIRGSIGQMGASDCSPYLYHKRYKSTSPNYFYGFGDKPASAFYTDGYVYDDLTWSHMTSYNTGIEAKMFGNKLSVEFDWFYKYTDRILDQAGTTFYAPSLGNNHPSWVNTGKMDDRGFELTVQHDNWLTCGINYSVRGLVSWARNRVLYRETSDDHPSYRSQFGRPLGELYGYKYKGIFQTQEEVDNAPNAPSGYAGIGEIMYEDINGDGKFTRDQDYVRVGRPSLPELNYSLNGEISWKGLSLSLLFYGVAICDYPLSGYYYTTGHTDGTIYTRPFYENGNTFKYLVERSWRPDRTDTKYPRLHAAYNSNNDNFSDLWVVSGAYFRLKNLQLSYELPGKFTKKAGLDRVSLYIAGNNLFTITEFPYLDPENPGINNGYYPQQKTYSLGFNLTF